MNRADQPEPAEIKPGVRFDFVQAVATLETCEVHDWPTDESLCGSFLALIRSKPRTQTHPLVCVDCAARLREASQ